MSQGHNTLPLPGLEPTDHWTTEQSHGIGMPAVHLTMHVKSNTLYGRTVVQLYGCTSKFFQLAGLLLFCIIIGLRSVSSAIIRSQWKLKLESNYLPGLQENASGQVIIGLALHQTWLIYTRLVERTRCQFLRLRGEQSKAKPMHSTIIFKLWLKIVF